MDNNDAEMQGRIEALARQRNLALDEAVFHAGRVKSLQETNKSLTEQIKILLEQVQALQPKAEPLVEPLPAGPDPDPIKS